MKLCLQDEVFLCTTDGAKVAVGLTQPQLGGYDSYCHNQIVGQGNARVLVQTSLMLAPLIYPTANHARRCWEFCHLARVLTHLC